MPHPIEWDPAADRQLRKLDRVTAVRILNAVDGLATNPWPGPPTVTPLTGIDGYRLRVGNYRVIFEIVPRPDAPSVIMIVKVRHRRDVYDR